MINFYNQTLILSFLDFPELHGFFIMNRPLELHQSHHVKISMRLYHLCLDIIDIKILPKYEYWGGIMCALTEQINNSQMIHEVVCVEPFLTLS